MIDKAAIIYFFALIFTVSINSKNIKVGYLDSFYYLLGGPGAYMALEDAAETGKLPQDVNIR